MNRLSLAGLRNTGIALGAVIVTASLTSAAADAQTLGVRPGATVATPTPPAFVALSSFTAGDLVVYRDGDASVGTTNSGGTSEGAPVYADEYTAAGSYVGSVKITGAGGNPLVASGTATSEGQLTLSANGQCLLATGYDAATGTTSLTSTASNTTPRTVAIVSANGSVDTSTALTDFSTGNNPRSATSNDCTNLWAAGAAGGIEYTQDGDSTGTTVANTPASNFEEVQDVDGQLYASTQKTSPYVFAIGTGLPTTGSQTETGFTFSAKPTAPYSYALLTVNSTSTAGGPDTLYIADNMAKIEKYNLINGTWTAEGSVTLPSDATNDSLNPDLPLDLTANDVNGTVHIYATAVDTKGTDGAVYSVTDSTGYAGTLSGTASVLTSLGSDTEAFRGIAFAPGTTIGSGGGSASGTAPTIAPAYTDLPAAQDATSNPTLPITVGDTSASATITSFTATSSNTSVAPAGGVTLTNHGSGSYTLSVVPGSTAGTSTITLTATDSNNVTTTQTITYGLSAPEGGLTNETTGTQPVYYDGAGNASSEVNVGNGYFLAGDDEYNVLHLYKDGTNSEPVNAYDFTGAGGLPYGGTTIDIEAAASYTSGANQFIYWFGSESTSSSGNARPATNTVFETEVSGTAPNLTVTYLGAYSGLRTDLINWDTANGNPLNLSTAAGATAKSIGGINIEGAEFAPNSTTTVDLAFRAPLENPYTNSTADTGTSSQDALLVPVNVSGLIKTTNTTSTTGLATFPTAGIELNLGGLGIREIRKNANNQYLIIGGSSGGSNSVFRLYAWDGVAGDPAVLTRTSIPAPSTADQSLGGFAWEGIGTVPALTDGNTVELVQDDGDFAWYGNGQSTKSSPALDAALSKDLGATFTIELASQSLSVSSTPPTGAAVGGSYTPTATATSGLPVAFTVDPTSTPGACTITGGTVSFTAAGTCEIDTDQAGNYGYDPASEVQQSVTVAAAPASPAALISEWRPVGPNGATGDDYVDLANTTASALSVTGWSLTFVNSTGTVYSASLTGSIPVGGHLLAADSGTGAPNAYSLSSVAMADANYTLPAGFGAPVGVKLLDGTGDLVDAVGFTGAPAGFSEGTPLNTPTGYPTGQFAWTRNYSSGALLNTENNASDYSFVSTTNVGDANYGSPTAGVPGPLGEASPIVHNEILQSSLVDPNVSASASPNFSYNANTGIVDINRTLTNCSDQPTTGACADASPGTVALTATRLQFRVTGLTTGILLAESSSGDTFDDASNNPFTVSALALAPPAGMTAGLNAVLVATPDLPSGGLTSGSAINVEFQFAVQAHGSYSFAYNAEDDLVPQATSTDPGSTDPGATDPGPAASTPSAAPDETTPAALGPVSAAAPVTPTTTGTINGATATAVVTPTSTLSATGSETAAEQAAKAKELKARKAKELKARKAKELKAKKLRELKAKKLRELKAKKLRELKAKRLREFKAKQLKARELKARKLKAATHTAATHPATTRQTRRAVQTARYAAN